MNHFKDYKKKKLKQKIKDLNFRLRYHDIGGSITDFSIYKLPKGGEKEKDDDQKSDKGVVMDEFKSQMPEQDDQIEDVDEDTQPTKTSTWKSQQIAGTEKTTSKSEPQPEDSKMNVTMLEDKTDLNEVDKDLKLSETDNSPFSKQKADIKQEDVQKDLDYDGGVDKKQRFLNAEQELNNINDQSYDNLEDLFSAAKEIKQYETLYSKEWPTYETPQAVFKNLEKMAFEKSKYYLEKLDNYNKTLSNIDMRDGDGVIKYYDANAEDIKKTLKEIQFLFSEAPSAVKEIYTLTKNEDQNERLNRDKKAYGNIYNKIQEARQKYQQTQHHQRTIEEKIRKLLDKIPKEYAPDALKKFEDRFKSETSLKGINQLANEVKQLYDQYESQDRKYDRSEKEKMLKESYNKLWSKYYLYKEDGKKKYKNIVNNINSIQGNIDNYNKEDLKKKIDDWEKELEGKKLKLVIQGINPRLPRFENDDLKDFVEKKVKERDPNDIRNYLLYDALKYKNIKDIAFTLATNYHRKGLLKNDQEYDPLKKLYKEAQWEKENWINTIESIMKGEEIFEDDDVDG